VADTVTVARVADPQMSNLKQTRIREGEVACPEEARAEKTYQVEE
jgi:hypothetical protein